MADNTCVLRICSLIVLAISLAAPVIADEFGGRIRFSDGDTLRVGFSKVRLFGVDAPEKAESCKTHSGEIWACGSWATREARNRFNGKVANCALIEMDRYGRKVAVCRVEGEDIAETLVRAGIVFAYRKYSLDYVDAEKEAAFAERGLWAGPTNDPAEFRAAGRTKALQSQDAAPQGCVIKGNISKSGQIYHVPGQKFYDETSISRARGERWFCSAAQAKAAGWRAARQ